MVTIKLCSSEQDGEFPACTKIVWVVVMTAPEAIGPTPPAELK